MNLLALIFGPQVRFGAAALVLATALTGCAEGVEDGAATDGLPLPADGAYDYPPSTGGEYTPPSGGEYEPGTTPPMGNGDNGGTSGGTGDMAGPAGGDIGSILCGLIGGCGDAGVLPPVPSDGGVVSDDPNDTIVPGREPDPANPKECPKHAPENPIGSCIGVPIYAVCSYTTYNCICDWIHWICI